MKPLILFALAISTSVAQTVDVKLHDNYLIVAQCSVGNQPNLVAVVDTGATETIIDLQLVKLLSLTTKPDSATFTTRDIGVQAVAIPEVVFGPIRVHELPGIAADLSSLTHQLGIRPSILIGMDLLRRSPFLIDYHKKQMVFGQLPEMRHSAALLADSRLLLVKTAIEQQVLTLQIDTGLNGILIYGDRLHAPVMRSVNAHSAAFGGTMPTDTASVARLQVGDWIGRQIPAAIAGEAPKNLHEFDGLLGPTAIGAHRVGFDFQNSRFTWD